jgi:hypothetical protein
VERPPRTNFLPSSAVFAARDHRVCQEVARAAPPHGTGRGGKKSEREKKGKKGKEKERKVGEPEKEKKKKKKEGREKGKRKIWRRAKRGYREDRERERVSVYNRD